MARRLGIPRHRPRRADATLTPLSPTLTVTPWSPVVQDGRTSVPSVWLRANNRVAMPSLALSDTFGMLLRVTHEDGRWTARRQVGRHSG